MKKKSNASESYQPGKTQSGRKKIRSSPKTKKQGEHVAPRIVEDHIPPLGVRGGSFSIELKHDLVSLPDVPTDPRPKKYTANTLDAEQYGRITRVLVFTEIEEDVDRLPHSFTLDDNVELRIWLQTVKRSPANERDFDALSSEPQVVIKGGVPAGVGKFKLRIELDNNLGARGATHKGHRLSRFSHNGFGRDFRIGRWRVVDRRNNVRAQGEGDENYDFLIFFADPTRL